MGQDPELDLINQNCSLVGVRALKETVYQVSL